MLDDLAFSVEAKDVNGSSFLAGPIQVTHVYEGQISIDGDTLHLARNPAGLLDVGHDAVEPIGEKADCAECTAPTRDPEADQFCPD